jgi:hypothetical protein
MLTTGTVIGLQNNASSIRVRDGENRDMLHPVLNFLYTQSRIKLLSAARFLSNIKVE